MRFFTKKKRTPVPVILPLIDILAILLIFFIVTTTFKRQQRQLLINLPESQTATEAPAETESPLLLQIASDEQILFAGQPISIEELAPALINSRENEPGRTIAMQADKGVPFGVVVRVLDALKEAGIRNIPAFTEPQQAETASPNQPTTPPPTNP